MSIIEQPPELTDSGVGLATPVRSLKEMRTTELATNDGWDASVLDKAAQWLKSTGDKAYSSRCKGVVWDAKGLIFVGGHDACHSWVSSAWYKLNFNSKEKDKGFLILNCYNHTKNKESTLSEEAHNAWIDWLCSDEMPLSKYVLNKHDTETIRNGGVIISCKRNGGITEGQSMWFCKAMRTAWEDSTVVKTWYELVSKHNIHPLFAYLVSDCVHIESGKYVVPFTSNTHASVWCYKTGEYNLENLFSYELSNSKDSTSSATWDSEGSGFPSSGYRIPFQSKCTKTVKKDDGWGFFSETQKACTLDEFVAWLHEVQDEYTKPKTVLQKLRKKVGGT